MNIQIVDEYSKNDNLNILKEECAELITAASHLQRARRWIRNAQNRRRKHERPDAGDGGLQECHIIRPLQ